MRLYTADIQVRATFEDSWSYVDDKYQHTVVSGTSEDQVKFKVVEKFPELKLAESISKGLARIGLTELPTADFQDCD